MEDDVAAVSAVQCSVIQYCPDNAQPAESVDSPDSSEKATEPPENGEVESINKPVEVISLENSSDTCNNEPIDNEQQSIAIKSQAIDHNVQESITSIKLEENHHDFTNQTITNEIERENVDEPKEESNLETSSVKNEVVKQEFLAVKEEPSALENDSIKQEVKQEDVEPEHVVPKKRKKKNSMLNGGVKTPTPPPPVDEPDDEEEEIIESESDDEVVNKPRRRGRCKKNPELIPAHLAPDIALGYRMLLKFLETPQFSGFLRPGHLNAPPGDEPAVEQITCLNQIKKKFEENVYKRLAEFISDVRALLTSVYTVPRNTVAVKRALRLEQVLEQRIAQLPNYLRPQCSLVLSPDEVSNSPKKIRINKGGGFVSLLLERADKQRAEKDREKRKVLAEERKQLKEEQDKDVQDWEINVLMKDNEEAIKSMWELPQIGHFIHLCANILNIGDVSQYEVERMLLMPQCSETLDLLITALLSNSLVRAKLDRTPSMPYTIWSPQIRTRVNAWYRAYQREFGNAQKVFEEIGVEPEFWDVVGTEHSPLDYFYLHEIPLIQRVWILKTLCDVDFVRKKTVYDNVRQQLLEELQGSNLGVDRHGNRYIHFPQFGMTALRIYRQGVPIEEGITPSDLVESQEGFEERKGEISIDKVFRDVWDVGVKSDGPSKKGKKKKKQKQTQMKVKITPTPPKTLRQSARAKRKVYVDSSGSDCSDTDLATLKNKLYDNQNKPEKTFISLTVFRLPRDKVKPVSIKKSYYSRKLEREEAERLRLEEREANKDKLSVDDDASESRSRMDDDDEDETKDNFTVKNLENLKMVLKKGSEDNDNATDGSVKEEDKFRYNTPAHMMPDRSKFYCVVDSVDGLRQLISQFASDDNDLEIINRSTLRSGKKAGKSKPTSPSCEVQLIERLQKLVDDLEAWEMDFIKTSRSIRDKLYKEFTNFTNRPEDYVHPNEAYWQKIYEELPAPAPPPAEPELPPTPAPVAEVEPGQASTSSRPPSPLGGLRPRTRTRQQQHQPVIKVELDEELDDELESSESDDNWEMPAKKRKKSGTEVSRITPAPSRQSKRATKKYNRHASPSGDDKVDKAKRALFWSPRSTDPSEELNWETNRQKILEKHNSPRKVLHGDIESEMSEVENALRTTASSSLKKRVLPPPVPGNRKPYYSSAQLKAMGKKKDSDVQIIGGHNSDVQMIQQKKRAVGRMSKAGMKKSAGTQSSELVDLAGDGEKVGGLARTVGRVQMRAAVPPPSHDEYFVTDGSVYVKIEYQSVQELIKNQDAVRKFGDRLDLNKKIQIVKKKVETTQPPPPQPAPIMVQTNSMVQTIPDSAMKMSPGVISEQMRPSGLRFIRPQNVSNEVEYLRPTQRMPGPQPNFVYVQTTQPQSYVQLQQGLRPGLVQVMARPGAPGLVAVTDKAVANSGAMVATQNYATFTQGKPEDGMVVSSNQVDLMGLLSSASASNQVGFIQVQAGGKQPVQFVQVSQANAGVVQAANPGMGTQNILRLATTVSNSLGGQPAPSFVRLASTGQIVQLATAPPSGGTMTFKPQMVTNNPATSGSPQSGGAPNLLHTQSASNQCLVQVQGLPGEPISYIPMPAGMKAMGNLVQIQAPMKASGQMGTFVQMATPPRQQSPVGRFVQVQGSPRAQGVMMQTQTTPRPQGTVVQMVPARPQGGMAANQANPRPQTTVVQVYGAPRMQTTMMQMQGGSRPQTVQVRAAVSQTAQQPGGPRPAGATTMLSAAQAPQQSMTSVQTSQTPQSMPQQTIVQLSSQQGSAGQMGTLVQISSPQQTSPGQMGTIVQMSASQQGSPRPMRTIVQMSQASQQSSPMSQPTIVSMSQALPQQTSPRPMGMVQLSSVAQQQNNIRPTLMQMSQAGHLQNNVARSGGNAMVQMSQAAQQQIGARTVAVASTQVRPAQRPMGPIIRIQGPVRAQGVGNVVRAQTASPVYANAARPAGPGIIAVAKPGTQMVQVSASAAKTMGSQVVQMPLPSGKPGYFQIQNAAGQPVSIMHVVTSGQPTSTSSLSPITSMPALTQVQGNSHQVKQLQNTNTSQGNFIQLQTSTAATSTAGLVQFQAGARPQLVQIQGTAPRPPAGRPVGPSIARPAAKQTVYSIQIADEQGEVVTRTTASPARAPPPGQTVRLIAADGKPGQTISLPMLVRSSGSKPGTPTASRAVGQPVMIKLDEEEEDVKIVRESPAMETVDILHGELSAKETAEGWRYSVKTSAGKDHVLTNNQVEQRRAANNGRMF